MVRKAIILAADPPALLPLANRPLVAHVVSALARAGISQAMVVASPAVRTHLMPRLADLSRECTVRFAEPAEGGVPATLASVPGFVDGDPFLLHFGDSLCRADLGSVLRLAPAALDTTVLLQPVSGPHPVVEIGSQGLQAGELPAGAWLLGAGVPDATRELPGSGNRELEITTMMRHLASRGGRIERRPVGDWWRYRDRAGAQLEGNRFVLEGLSGRSVEAQLVDTRIQGNVWIDPSAQLESSIVRGPAVIGARVRLRDAYVGPYSSIGDDVFIEGAEVEHSIILPGASIKHLGKRLEASVVGPGAKVFRDFGLPRALRLNVGEGAEVSLT